MVYIKANKQIGSGDSSKTLIFAIKELQIKIRLNQLVKHTILPRSAEKKP